MTAAEVYAAAYRLALAERAHPPYEHEVRPRAHTPRRLLPPPVSESVAEATLARVRAAFDARDFELEGWTADLRVEV